MTNLISTFCDRRLLIRLGAVFVIISSFMACGRSEHTRVQGYVEGEFVYVSSPLSGPLQSLNVQRGAQVKAGDTIFELDRTLEKATLEQTQA
jgi:HlyD family secretion protein